MFRIFTIGGLLVPQFCTYINNNYSVEEDSLFGLLQPVMVAEGREPFRSDYLFLAVLESIFTHKALHILILRIVNPILYLNVRDNYICLKTYKCKNGCAKHLLPNFLIFLSAKPISTLNVVLTKKERARSYGRNFCRTKRAQGDWLQKKGNSSAWLQ